MNRKSIKKQFELYKNLCGWGGLNDSIVTIDLIEDICLSEKHDMIFDVMAMYGLEIPMEGFRYVPLHVFLIEKMGVDAGEILTYSGCFLNEFTEFETRVILQDKLNRSKGFKNKYVLRYFVDKVLLNVN